MSSLPSEWQFFQEHEAQWMKSHSGEWVCVHNNQHGKFHKTQEQAIKAALKLWPNSPGRIGVYCIGEPIETISLSELAVASITVPD